MAELSRSEIFNILRERGVGSVVVEFSGGGDEGGVHGIDLFSPSGNKMLNLDEDYGEQIYNPQSGEYEYTRQPNADYQLATALGNPVYERYYSFAGEFYVTGTINYDVQSETIKLNKYEMWFESYKDSEEDL